MSGTLEKLYYKMPVWMQNMAVSAYGYIWYKRRLTGAFPTELEECRKREFYTAEQWEEYNNSKLQQLLLHALSTVPFYKKIFADYGITEKDIASFTIHDLHRLPILDKETYRRHGQTTMMSNLHDKDGAFFPSSGSTGTPTQTWYSKKMHQTYFAIFEARVNYWAGLDYRVPRGTFGPRRIVMDPNSTGPFYRYNFVEKQTYFSAFHLSAKNIHNYVEGLIKHNAEYLTGYCMSNYIMARFIEESGLEAPKLKAILTSSEKLTLEMRDTFRRVYQCETFDSYNGVEACNLISECEYHNLHIVPDVGYTELIKEDGTPCQPGETGHVIATGFINFDQPLIRYRMGDLLTLSKNQTCQCGRSMPVVEEIVGRIMDTVITEDGREMVSFYRVFSNNTSIMESQVVQHTLTKFDINLVVNKVMPEHEKEDLLTKLRSQLGDHAEVTLNFLDTIPRGANGKFKSVISHIKRKEVQRDYNN